MGNAFLWPLALAAALMWTRHERMVACGRWYGPVLFTLGALSGVLHVLN